MFSTGAESEKFCEIAFLVLLHYEVRTFDLLRRLGAFWLRFNPFPSQINRSPL
jgi:hypothetical protein